MKIGRNTRCLCGSGKKYKHCCGSIDASAASNLGPGADVRRRMQLEMQRAEAKEHRRQLMQGLGRPIISFESNGFRLVAVGPEMRWSKGWFTFHDFLLDYIKHMLTPEWGNTELKKPDDQCHPLINWFRKVRLFHQAHAAAGARKLYTGRMNGAVKAYLGLAYDLYLCAHNADLPDLLLKRLRSRGLFEAAVYEAFVVGCFAKAGFAIEMENEADSTTSHCEFVATHKITGRKFSVEAKAVTSASSRAGATAEPPRVRDKLYAALKKKVQHPRIIFIELSRTQTLMANGEPDWAAAVDQEISLAEKELTIEGQPAPPAYLFVSNRAFMHALDSDECPESGMAYGFKIDEFLPRSGFSSILEAARARDRHIEAHWLIKALHTRPEIPSTFDDRMPEEAFGEVPPAPLRFGETYLVPDETGCEVPGILYEGSVLENEQTAYGHYRLADGRSITCTVPLSDDELAAYRRSPDTFFGIVRQVPKASKTPLDLYDFFFDTYSHSSRENLREFMASWPNFGSLKDLAQRELAEIYSAEMAAGVWARTRSTGS